MSNLVARTLACCLSLFLLQAPFAAFAQSASDPLEEDDDGFSDLLRDFGYAGGAAWQCAEEEARPDIERQSMVSFHGLVRLFGSDEAFFFASAFGAGTSAQIARDECSAFEIQFREGLTKADVE
jgi:hypothetical protein